MAGITIFDTLAEAVRMGFTIYDRTPDGFIVQRRTERGYALALVVPRKPVAPQ
ncbi:MAG TPA: hypothetical protein VNG31_10340 [Candidatus Baltobacteraceae bacterium]|nr:hypothetical protein [Candidatus Baltobacteraceae bacterium]